MLRDWGIQIPGEVVTAYRGLPPLPVSSPGSLNELIEKPIEPEDLVLHGTGGDGGPVGDPGLNQTPVPGELPVATKVAPVNASPM